MVALLDVNLLVALAWPNHIHHPRARAWFGDHRDEGWAICSVTRAEARELTSTPGSVRPASPGTALGPRS